MQWSPLSLASLIFGDPIRNIPSENTVFISFDDGPDPELTPRILDLLKEYGAKATFFLIAHKAEKFPRIVERIIREGHSIGNHSLDHKYGTFFKGSKNLLKWVKDSEELLKSIGINKSVGFRPPVGIRTPELAYALRKLELPLILWKQRCFDRVIKFTTQRARSLAKRTQAGDIILLHDVQKSDWHDTFLSGLKTLIEELSKKSFFLAKIDALQIEKKSNVLLMISRENNITRK